jgi:hypothetical protein
VFLCGFQSRLTFACCADAVDVNITAASRRNLVFMSVPGSLDGLR